MHWPFMLPFSNGILITSDDMNTKWHKSIRYSLIATSYSKYKISNFYLKYSWNSIDASHVIC